MAIVLRANKESSELGGHIASFQSAATLYDTGFMHFGTVPTGITGATSSMCRGTLRQVFTRAPSWKDG